MSQWSNLKVDIMKVIQNFVEMYPYSAAECLILEAIANCLDAKATRIDLTIYADVEGRKVLRVADNGRGMTKDEFEENYHALSISSKTKGEGIGFAGVGSKLYLVFLATGENIVTETKSDDFQSASKITVIDGEPKWAYVDKRTLVSNGTVYEVRLNASDAEFLAPERIVRIVQSFYNAILLGRYGDIVISYGGERIAAWKPETSNETGKPVTFKIRNAQFQCFFSLTKQDLDDREGLEIIVFGKRIKEKQWFDFDYLIKSNLRKRIAGQILADGLAQLLTTNKSDFRYQAAPRLWGAFRQRAYDAFGDWLECIGALDEKQFKEDDPKLDSMCKELETQINKLLRDPAFIGYNPFLKTQMHSTVIPSTTGDVEGKEIESAQKTEGTLGGLDSGEGVNVAGPNEGKSVIESPGGGKLGDLSLRRVRHGISINLADEPKNPKESWLTSEALVINKGHPVFVKSSVLGYAAEAQHILRCVFFSLLEYNPPQTFNETLDRLREFYVKWSTV